jgi:Holliday junction resolvase RusA-like endonuclease
MPRPKSHFNSKGFLKIGAPNFCPKKPDFDNLAKAVADQLTNSGVWEDDDQVCISVIVKRFADSIEAQGCEIHIELLPE